MMPATVNLEVDMVAQPGQDPALQLAVTGDVPIGTVDSNDAKEKKVEPENKRVRSTPPRMQKRSASESLRDAPRRSVWSGSAAAGPTSPIAFDLSPSPPKMHLGDSGWTVEKLA